MNPEKPKSRIQKMAVSAFYGLLSWILPLLLSFFATKLLIKHLGSEHYGIYMLVLSFIGYTFTFNFGRAATKYIAEYRFNNAVEKIKNIISATALINFAIGIIAVAVLSLSAGTIVRDVLKIEENSQNEAVNGIWIAAVIVFFTMFSQVFNSMIQGVHRYDLSSKINLFNGLATVSGNIALVWAGFGLTGLFVWNLIIVFFTLGLNFITARHFLPEMNLFHLADRKSLALVFNYSLSIVGYQIFSNLLVLFERSWITRHLGTEELTHYVVPMTVSFQILFFTTSLLQVIFPVVSELQSNLEKLEKLYVKAMKMNIILTAFMCLTMIVFAKSFLTLWLGADFAEKATFLMQIHILSFSIVSATGVSWIMSEGLGYPKLNLLMAIVCLAVSVPLMIFLTQDYGTGGVAVGRLAGFAVWLGAIFFVERFFFKRLLTEFWASLILKLLPACAAAILSEKLLSDFFSASWFGILFSVAVGGIIYLSIIWLLRLITAEERQMIRNIVRI